MKENQGLYRQQFEHDNCGIGAVINSKGIKSHTTVENALKIVENLEHRAGKDAEGKTGDGVGILLQISHKFFKKECEKLGIEIGEEREYGIAQLFFPQDELKCNQAKKMFEIIVEKEGLELLGYREVPVYPEVLGHKARVCMPHIMQAFIKKPVRVEKGLEFDRKLYIARRVFEQSNENTYVVSMSSRTIVYKGMFLVGQLRTFFGDLQDKDYESAIAMVHSRFSTNTNPSWERAHPNRFIVHNGEINTIRGNADKMLAREETMESSHLKNQLHKILPVVDTRGSDSAMLDNTLEFLVMSGMPLPLAVMITIPEPWTNNKTLDQDERDFYQYYATMMEPWDGPASIVFSDGDLVSEAAGLAEGLQAVSLNPAFLKPVTESILYACAYLEALSEVKVLLEGGRVSLGKESWVIRPAMIAEAGIQGGQNISSGISYEQYLAGMISALTEKERNYRAIDIMEMDIRMLTGNTGFAMDCCVERFRAQIQAAGSVRGNYLIDRTYGYY